MFDHNEHSHGKISSLLLCDQGQFHLLIAILASRVNKRRSWCNKKQRHPRSIIILLQVSCQCRIETPTDHYHNHNPVTDTSPSCCCVTKKKSCVNKHNDNTSCSIIIHLLSLVVNTAHRCCCKEHIRCTVSKQHVPAATSAAHFRGR